MVLGPKALEVRDWGA